ncbi:hypothetical protein [Dysgonomonas capnocytophagoides]|uniref:hypothetical protein n=1 Tax=Dysgonomonas capnocytophagoides TaxID=45254 RepID=UPI0039958781
MNYRIIDRNIAGKLSANETYTLFCLLSKSDFKTGLSHVKQETLKDIIGIKKIDTLQSHLSKFYELNILRKKTRGHIGDKGYFKTNIYHYQIPTDNWVRINLDFINNPNVPSKIKGFLILLKCLCVNNTNLLNYNKSQISRLLNIDIKTIRSYINLSLELKLIEETNSGFRILNKSILEDHKTPTVPKPYMKHHIDYYYLIYNFCIENSLPIPCFDDYLVMKLLMNFDDHFIIDRLSLSLDKFRNCKYLSLEYIAKTLGIKINPPKEKNRYELIIVK